MKETIEKIVNAWYRDWGYQPETCDFKSKLENLLPEYIFTQIDENTWSITSEL